MTVIRDSQPASAAACIKDARERGWTAVAEALEAVSGVSEADWQDALHPRDRLGKFAGKGLVQHLGMTPYREADEADTGVHYYGTQRFAQFERDLADVAREEGMRLHAVNHVRGVWQGGGEPSAQVDLVGTPEAARRVADRLANPYMQEGVIRFRAAKGGESRLWQSRTRVDRKKLEAAMEQSKLPGATMLPDGRVELIDIGRENEQEVGRLALELGATFSYTEGDAELRLAGQDYEDGRKRLIPVHPGGAEPPAGPSRARRARPGGGSGATDLPGPAPSG